MGHCYSSQARGTEGGVILGRYGCPNPTPPCPLPHPSAGQESAGRLSGWPRGKAKCIGGDHKAREHLMGHSRPLKPLPQAQGQRWPSCRPCSAQGGKGQPRPPRNLSAICLCNAQSVFPNASPAAPLPLISPGNIPVQSLSQGHRSLSVPSSLAGRDRPLYSDHSSQRPRVLKPDSLGLVPTANTGQVSPLPF